MSTRLILMADGAAPWPWMTLDGGGQVVARGVLEPGSTPPPVKRTVLVVPGVAVLVRRLALPSGREAQVAAAARWALRDDTAGDPDTLAVALQPGVGERLVAATAAGTLEGWRVEAERRGVAPDVILPDSLLIAPGEDGRLRVMRMDGRVVVRGHDLAWSGEPALADLVIGDRSVEMLDDPKVVEALMIRAALHPPLNLLGRVAPPPVGPQAWRLPAALAASLLLSPLVLTALAAARDDIRARSLHDDSVRVAQRLAPGPLAADRPAEALSRKRTGSTVAPGEAAAALWRALEQTPGVTLVGLSWADGVLSAELAHPDQAGAEAVRAALVAAGAAASVTETTPAPDGGFVSDLRLGVGQ